MKRLEKLARSVMLINVTIRGIGGEKKDRTRSAAIAQSNNADADRVNLSISTIKRERLKPVRVAAEAIRAELRRFGTPFGGTNTYAVPAHRVPDALTRIRVKIMEREDAVADMLADYDSIKAEAKLALGELWDEEKFPSKVKLQQGFTASVHVMPAPGLGTKLMMVTPEAADMLMQAAEESSREVFNGVINDAVQQLIEKVKHLHAVVTAKKPRIYETRLVQVCEAADLLRGFVDAVDDERLTALMDTADVLVASLPKVDDLRGDDGQFARMRVADKTSEVLAEASKIAEDMAWL